MSAFKLKTLEGHFAESEDRSVKTPFIHIFKLNDLI